MTLFPLLLALLIEQLRPLRRRHAEDVVALLHRGLLSHFVRSDDHSVATAWWLLTCGMAALAGMVHVVCVWLSPVLAFLFNVLVLYSLMGARAYAKVFADIHLALATGNLEGARRSLSGRFAVDCERANSGELARLAIEQALVTSHRLVFGTIFWWVVLPGPIGVVIYRVAQLLTRHVESPNEELAARFDRFARRAFQLVDALPVRVTALFFSVIGNFEDAIYCWRSQSMLWPDKASGILIASGAGALGVRLGLPIHASDGVVSRPEMGTGHKADTDHMQGAAQLVWRVLLLWLLLLALFGLAGLVGR